MVNHNKINSTNKIKIYIILLVIATLQEGLGLRKVLGGGIGTGTFGLFFFLQILIIIILLFPFFFRDKQLIYGKTNVLYKPILLLFILFIISILYSIFQVIIVPGTATKILYNISNLKYYLLFFLIIHWIENIEQLKYFLKGLVILGFIASIVVLLSLISGNTNFTTITSETTNEIGRAFRLMIPTEMLILYSLFIMFSKNLYQNTSKFAIYNYLLMFILFATFIMQMHRNVLASFFIVIIIVAFYTPKIKITKRISKFIILFLLCLFFISLLAFIKQDITDITNTYVYSKSEFDSQQGNLWFRLMTLINTVNYVLKNNFLLGIGFNWKDTDFLTYYVDQFSLGPTNDNSYTNIFIVYGLSGIIIYFYLFIKLFRSFFTLIIKTKDAFIRYISYANLLFLISILLIGFGSDNFIIYSNTTMFVVLFAVAYLVNICEINTNYNEKLLS